MENTESKEEIAAREWDVICEAMRCKDVEDAVHRMDVQASTAGLTAIMGMAMMLLRLAVTEERNALLIMLKQFYVTAYTEMNASG